MTKHIKTIETLYNKAQEKGEAILNGRIWDYDYREYGELQEKYKITINKNIVCLYHWGTKTLEFNTKTNKALYFYGQSRSDCDSIGTLFELLGANYIPHYKPSTGEFWIEYN